MPGIAVVDAVGRPVAVLPASQVLRVVVPDYVREDPALARVVDEAGAERLCVQRLADERVAVTCCRRVVTGSSSRPSTATRPFWSARR